MRFLPPITNHVYRQQRRAALVWGSLLGTFVWVSAAGYESSYPKLADRIKFAKTLGSNVGIRAMFGPAHHIETVKGFTAWRCGTVFALIGALWALLAATKTLRGDEEEGRADLLYAGPVTRASGLGHALGGLGAAFLVLYVTLAACTVAVGVFGNFFSFTQGVFFATAASAAPALFLAIGALTSQLVPTRRAASALGGAVFGVAILVRSVGETVDGARWMLWATPLGCIDKMRPLTGSRLAPGLLIVGLTAACLAAAAWLSTRRDVGGATLPSRDTARARTTLLGSPIGLAVRLTRGSTIAWMIGVGLAATIFGVVSSSVSQALDSKALSDLFARLGTELSQRGYIGLTFVMAAAMLSFTAASFVGAARREEAEGRLEGLLASPIRPRSWLAGRIVVAAVSLVAIGLMVGLGGWLGVIMSGNGIGFPTMVAAGLNVVWPGVTVLGLGSLAHGVAPRTASAVSYAVVAWSFLIAALGLGRRDGGGWRRVRGRRLHRVATPRHRHRRLGEFRVEGAIPRNGRSK
jgi:ABC-2 type transport system permease protein